MSDSTYPLHGLKALDFSRVLALDDVRSEGRRG